MDAALKLCAYPDTVWGHSWEALQDDVVAHLSEDEAKAILRLDDEAWLAKSQLIALRIGGRIKSDMASILRVLNNLWEHNGG